MSAVVLARALVAPETATFLDREQWTGLLTAARAERLLGTLAFRLDRRAAPHGVAEILDDARAASIEDKRVASWEAEMARRALVPLGVPVVLLKGTAFAVAGLDAGRGRAIGDLDILVPAAALADVEAALIGAGWEAVKESAYDDAYYRRWMHELPPLIHRDRDRVIDVHHTILPPTARPTPDAHALLADAVPLGNGLSVLSPPDMIVHAAAHLLADGDMAGGLRNLWDIDRLFREHDSPRFDTELWRRAERHQLGNAVRRALRLSRALFDTPVEVATPSTIDRLFLRRLLARDEWGREIRPATRGAFYVRSHWIRMPPHLLARHLAIKAGVLRAPE